MTDDWLGISNAKMDTRGSENLRRRFVRLLNPFVGKLLQLRTPTANVVAIGVEFLSLAGRIKHTEIRCCVSTTACCPLPTERIARQIGVHQSIPEPAGSLLPRQQQVFHEE